MKNGHYLYLGYYMNLRIFYYTEDKNIYADMNPKISNLPITVFAGASIMFYVLGRMIRLDEIHFFYVPIILLSIIIGIITGIVFSIYTDKKNREHFSEAEVFKISDADKGKSLLKEAKKITGIYCGFQILLILLGIIEPILFAEVKDVILLMSYFVIWFAITYFGLQFRIRERRKAIQYLKDKGL